MKQTQLEIFAEVTKIALTAENIREQLPMLRSEDKEPQLTMLSFGGGQDSFAMLYMMIHDKAFRKKYAPNDFFVAMSDTGNEFDYTYDWIKVAQKLCEDNGIHFRFITNDQGYHTPSWMDLKSKMRRNNIIFGSWGNKTCTGSLKIDVMNKYLHHYMCKLYAFPELSNKRSWKFYRQKFQTKARVLIGFAKNEETRVVTSLKNSHKWKVWQRENLQYVYPLVEEGLDRAACQKIILKYREVLMPPSNCMLCFYQSDEELLWLYRNRRSEFDEWVELERKKLETWTHVPKNLGAFGKETLTQKIEGIIKKIGHKSNEELMEYKMSHGHCVQSAF
jgi:hypothetical protein